MEVQPTVTTKKTFKVKLTPAEKAQRAAVIDRLTDQVMLRAEEFMPAAALVRAEVKKTVTKTYDKAIRAKIAEMLKK